MHWKKKSNAGARALYRSIRHGDRVFTQYVGTGLAAEFAFRSESLRRAERNAKRIAWDQELEGCAQVNAGVKDLYATVEQFIVTELLLTGFHRHRGNWRKRRVSRIAKKTA